MNNINKFWEGKRVLITGHTGFKGSWLLFWLLQEKAEICGFSLKETENSLFKQFIKEDKNFTDKFTHCVGDINNFDDLNDIVNSFKPQIIFHLAAQSLVTDGYKYPLKTFQTNIIGSVNLLESLQTITSKCAVIMITTDKVYENKEWCFGYRENDALGGHDPYSSSKAAAEIVINSWRLSFSNKKNNIFIATARSGNVIGGGDWSDNRIVPDSIRSLLNNEVIKLRNPLSRRPWQHVLDPLKGYLLLAEKLFSENNINYQSSFNFGPDSSSNKKVEELVNQMLLYLDGKWEKCEYSEKMYEAKLLNLNTDKALYHLNWSPTWDFPMSVKKTIQWYLKFNNNSTALNCCSDDLNSFLKIID